MVKAKKSLKGHRKRPRQLGPQTEQDKTFCSRWLIHFDKDRAYREAGFAGGEGSGWRANSKLQRFADYLRPIQEAKAKILAEKLAVDSEDVLNGMVKRVFFDPTEFYELTRKPLTEMVKATVDGKETRVEQEKQWDGRPVFGERMKPYSELTAEQRQVVEVTGESGGVIKYRLPTIREQHTFLRDLGRQYGMFADKLIVERHNHRHTHTHMSFEGVPTAKLQNLTRQMLPLVGLEFAQSLGYTAEDVAQASKDEGVVMTVPAKATAG